MDRVASEFHKNVSLLIKFIPPHDDLKKHFKEGMFDKPNTLGFIHVSYYLLNVYYENKPKVQWPVICKQTENKFRHDVRECFMTIANENLDLNFPPIFASHLLLARGTKFLLIMWKFSLVVLCTYLKKNHHCALTTNPKPGPCLDVTKDFLMKIAQDNRHLVSDIRKERDELEQQAADLLKNKTETQHFLKTEILSTREELKQVIDHAPVNAAAKKTLALVEDNEIIKMWANCISSTYKSMEMEVGSLTDEYQLIKSITNIVSVIKGHVAVLNARSLDLINLDPIYQLVPPEMQVLPYSLYSDKSLNLLNLFTIFVFLLQELQVRRENYDEFSAFKSQLETSNEDLKTAISQFHNVLEEINNSHLSHVKNMDELNDSHKVISNVPEFDKVLFMSSPSIHISSTGGGSNFNPNDLQLTPVEGVHKELFSRHMSSSSENMTCAKKPLHVQRINFDDSITFESSNTTIDKQQSFLRSRSALKNVDKYSKIFSSRNRKHDKKANKSIMNMMLPLMAKQQEHTTLVDSCNSSREISQDSLFMNPNLSSTQESSKEAEENRTSQKRRSISDLVERYKKILQERDSK